MISKNKKIALGVISHRTLQVERPEEIADLIRRALKHIEPERLILTSDCGFGRQAASRLHATYKMIALVRGANIVRKELGLPEAYIPGADAKLLDGAAGERLIRMALDPRITPARPDLAAKHLRGKVEAASFVEGTVQEVIAGIAPLRRRAVARGDAADRSAVRRADHRLRNRRRRLGLGPAQLRQLCRLAAGGGAAGARRAADPQGHGAAHVRVPRPLDQAAADRRAAARRAGRRGARAGQLCRHRGRRLHSEASSGAARHSRKRFRRGGRAICRRALSLGRQVEHGHRLLGAGAGRADRLRHQMPARQRHAGERARQAGQPRRPASAATSSSGRATSPSRAAATA